jgi:hypothetical protein
MAFVKLTPNMTSNIAPSGVVSADAQPAPYYAWRAFDGNDAGGYTWSNGDFTTQEKVPPHWLQYDFPEPQKVVHYEYTNSFGENFPVVWELWGWDGDAWVVVDSRDLSPAGMQNWEGDVAAPGFYSKYRLNITDWKVGFSSYFNAVVIYELKLFGVGPTEIEVPSINFNFSPVAPLYSLNASPSIPSTIVYRCSLIEETALVLPVSSIQLRYRNGSQSYLSVVVPDGLVYADGVASRSSGVLKLERGAKFADGSTQYFDLIQVDLETISDDGGGNNRSLTLSGHATYTNDAPKVIALQNVTFRHSGTTRRRFRASIDFNLRPGDTAVANGESIIVGMLTYMVSARGEFAEITEADNG